MLKKLPLQIAGLMLALAATGILLFPYGYIYQNFFGILSTLILMLLVLKLLIYPKEVEKELEHPIIASLYPTLSMGIMLLATYAKGYSDNYSFIAWTFGLMLHIYHILKFSKKFMKNIKTRKVYPSYLIVYVGVAAASITAPVFHMQSVGRILFYFGLACFIILLPKVLKRMLSSKIQESILPTTTIIAAPLSLSLAGYINSFQEKNIIIIYVLLFLSQLIFFGVLTQFPKILSQRFHPSFSSLTFPVVITTISLKLANGFLLVQGSQIPFLTYLVKFEEILSVLIVFYVLFRYIAYLLVSPTSN